MTRMRIGAAAVLAALAVISGVLASDVRRTSAAIDDGDTQFADGKRADWTDRTRLPPPVVRTVLGTGDDVDIRAGLAEYRRAIRTRRGFDNGAAQARVRARAAAVLADIASSAPAENASQAADLLGLLALLSTEGGAGADASADLAVGAFRDAIRLDPANVDAKVNLEIALRLLRARATRSGATVTDGRSSGAPRGAGSSVPGRGY